MTPTQVKILKGLQAQVALWGGQLLELSDEDYQRESSDEGFSEAPFTSWSLGTNHAQGLVCFTDHGMPTEDHMFAGALCHELGHVFAVKTPRDPEFEFLGWEVALFQTLGLTRTAFVKANADYGVGTYYELRDRFDLHVEGVWGPFDTTEMDGLPLADQLLLTERLLTDAASRGLVVGGKPVSLRASFSSYGVVR